MQTQQRLPCCDGSCSDEIREFSYKRGSDSSPYTILRPSISCPASLRFSSTILKMSWKKREPISQFYWVKIVKAVSSKNSVQKKWMLWLIKLSFLWASVCSCYHFAFCMWTSQFMSCASTMSVVHDLCTYHKIQLSSCEYLLKPLNAEFFVCSLVYIKNK